MRESLLTRYGVRSSGCVVVELSHRYVVCGVAFPLSEFVVRAVCDGLYGFENLFEAGEVRYLTCCVTPLLHEWEKVLRRVCRGRRAPYVRARPGGFVALMCKNEWLVEGRIRGSCPNCYARRCVVCVDCLVMPCCCS